jgi:hypothetical protein
MAIIDLPVNYTRLERALQAPEEVYKDSGHARYHNQQASKRIDTAAKRLARAAEIEYVTCPCGESFPSAITTVTKKAPVVTKGRPKRYESPAERQRAYRERKGG